jgi:hypothetical protein
MRAVVDRNVVMRRMTIFPSSSFTNFIPFDATTIQKQSANEPPKSRIKCQRDSQASRWSWKPSISELHTSLRLHDSRKRCCSNLFICSLGLRSKHVLAYFYGTDCPIALSNKSARNRRRPSAIGTHLGCNEQFEGLGEISRDRLPVKLSTHSNSSRNKTIYNYLAYKCGLSALCKTKLRAY